MGGHVEKLNHGTFLCQCIIGLQVSCVLLAGVRVQVEFAHVSSIDDDAAVVEFLNGVHVSRWVGHDEEDNLAGRSARDHKVFQWTVRLRPEIGLEIDSKIL